MVNAGGIIVIFLGHLSAMQAEGKDLCKFRRVSNFEIIFKVLSCFFFSELSDGFYFPTEIR